MLHIIEHMLAALDEDFCFRVLSKDRMGTELGVTNFSPPEICIREDVYLHASKNNGAARFTCAHELGHFLLHSGESRPRKLGLVDERIQERFLSSEWQADYFAAAFLMPFHVVRQFSTPLELAESCNVSLTAATNRMQELQLIKRGSRPLPPIVIEFLRSKNRLPPDRDQ
jgi:Zn-dependent peptidase ImmA (M78 family)